MLAAILVSQNQPLIVDEVELPSKLDVGQVLVKVHTSGICGSQLGEISGVKGPDKFLPHLMGHEGCATVLDIGPGVKNVKVDDLVVLHWRKGNGIDSKTPVYNWKGKKLNAGWVTTFNTHAVVSENRCTRIPSDTNKDIAALFGCAVTTGFGVIENNCNLQIGESVVVFGSGGIGLNIIQAASLRSAWPIIAVDLFDKKLNLALKMGATHTINSSKESFKNSLSNIIKTEKVDVFIDNTGLPEVIELGYKFIKSKGKLVLVGVPKLGNKINIFTLPLHFGKTIIGSHGGESDPGVDIIRYLNLINQRQIPMREIISERFKLHEINKAMETLKKGSIPGRVILDL